MNRRILIVGVPLLALALGLCQIVGAATAAPAVATPAPETAPRTTTALDTLLQEAALQNAGLRGAFARWQAEAAQIPQAGALPDPRLSYTYYAESVETRVGPQRHRIGVSQSMPWFGTRGLREEAAVEAAAVARYQFEQDFLELRLHVARAYYALWLLERSTVVAAEHLQLVTQLEGAVRSRLRAGGDLHATLAQTQVELGRIADRVASLKARRAPTLADLNATLGRPLHQPLALPEQLPPAELVFTDAQLVALFTETSPELARLDHLAAREGSMVDVTRRERYPDLSLGVAYIETGPAQDPTAPDSGKDPLLATIALSLPLWQGKERAAEDAARMRHDAARQMRTDAQQRLTAQLERSLVAYHDAHRKARLYADTLVPKAREAMLVSRRSFEAGKTDFTGLIDAQRVLLELELTQAEAEAERGQQIAQLQKQVGRRVDRASPTPPTIENQPSGVDVGIIPGDETMQRITTLLTAAMLLTTPALAGEKTTQPEAAHTQKKGKPQTVCPVMGGKINKKQFADVEGKRIYVCCPGCIKLIEKSPKVYIKKLEDDGVAITPTPKARKSDDDAPKSK